MDRAERRCRTLAYGRRAQKTHLRHVHRTGPIDCVCELSLWFFAKRKSVGCGCHRHPPGQPKLRTGICGGWGYQATVLERIDGRRLCRAWQSALDGAEVHALRTGRYRMAR